MIVNLQELCEITGSPVSTLKSWIQRGCPIIQEGGRGVSWQIDTVAVFKWREDDVKRMVSAKPKGDDQLRDLKVKREAALTEKAEIELLLLKGDLIPQGDAVKIMADAAAVVRSRLMTLEHTVPPRAAKKSAPEIKAIVGEEVRIVLGEFTDSVSAATSGGAGGEPETAPEPDRQRVG